MTEKNDLREILENKFYPKIEEVSKSCNANYSEIGKLGVRMNELEKNQLSLKTEDIKELKEKMDKLDKAKFITLKVIIGVLVAAGAALLGWFKK